MIDGPEEWAGVKGFPDYAVSTHGNVKNVRHDSLLSPRTNSYGKQRVVLYREGQRYDLYVHRLVAEAFLDAYNPNVRVQHRAEQLHPETNHVYNLRFPEGYRMGYMVKNPEVPRYRRVRIVGTDEVFRNVETLARYINGDPSSIYRVLRGERRTHKGYTFEYIEGES